MYDSCPERIVGHGIPIQSRVRLSIRWHRVQPVIVSLRDNARRLCPRTALSERYVLPFASQCQLVWSPQHFRMSLDLACF